MKYRNIPNDIIRLSEEKLYYKTILEYNKNNSCKTCRILNQVINKNKCVKTKTVFKHNGNNIHNDNEIANCFNKFFLNTGKESAQKIPKNDICKKKYIKGSNIKSIFIYPVTEQEICQVITNLKNASTGHDGIDAKVLKIIKYHVIKPTTHNTYYYIIIDIQYRTINMENGVCKIRNTWAPS